ncbi:hypothetical protein IFM89_008303 [Coptis chinensis]|uniref:Uncharacterized protein n=1 Tax=Coptis chinensis TaxID=261450 RepID=A0A835I8Y9_9MAGN|nr:hypothetical protein IFM89_008303 [Coptis chinensis]
MAVGSKGSRKDQAALKFSWIPLTGLSDVRKEEMTLYSLTLISKLINHLPNLNLLTKVSKWNQWNPPTEQRNKLNADGALNDRGTGHGGVLRDGQGTVIEAYSEFFHPASGYYRQLGCCRLLYRLLHSPFGCRLGARINRGEYDSSTSNLQEIMRDTDSHTASTAGGNVVKGASYYGLATFDDAIADRVNVISVSLGSNSAGNAGPFLRTVSNFSPWSLTVAASTIDRKFVSQVVLGDGQIFTGTAINNFVLNGTSYPLITGEEIGGKDCSLRWIQDGSWVLLANGIGVVMADIMDDYASSFPLPPL